ncbi:MAG: GIY-YIG nuclease family protein [Verrucomicrobiota bacterium]
MKAGSPDELSGVCSNVRLRGFLCEDLEARFVRHNAGIVPATKHGIPWVMVHFESCSTRAEAVKRELYYKTGAGRDEVDRIVAAA